jgi:hypothetical protein
MPVMTETREDPKLDLAAEVLGLGGTIRLHALGTSMLPSIWPGDVLSIEHRPGDEIVPGDIVLAVRNRRFFVHRLVAKRNSQWILRGDSLPQNDAPVAESQVLGKVSMIHRHHQGISPNPRVPLAMRALVRMLRHSDSLRYIALRIYSFWRCRAKQSWPLR